MSRRIFAKKNERFEIRALLDNGNNEVLIKKVMTATATLTRTMMIATRGTKVAQMEIVLLRTMMT